MTPIRFGWLTFLKEVLCGTKGLYGVLSRHVNVFDHREDVQNVVWTDGGFALSFQEVVSESQLMWTQTEK